MEVNRIKRFALEMTFEEGRMLVDFLKGIDESEVNSALSDLANITEDEIEEVFSSLKSVKEIVSHQWWHSGDDKLLALLNDIDTLNLTLFLGEYSIANFKGKEELSCFVEILYELLLYNAVYSNAILKMEYNRLTDEEVE